MTGPTTVIDEYADLPDRIRKSTQRLKDLGKQIESERAIRDDLITQAVDYAGLLPAAVAHYAEVSATHINRILAASSEDRA